jgi:biotin operon repressor
MSATPLRRKRPTTYARELYRLRERGALPRSAASSSAFDILHYLCHLLDCYGRDDVFKKQTEIADALGYSEQVVRRAIKELKELGFVLTAEKRSEKGYRSATVFRLTGFGADARWSNALPVDPDR